MRRVLIAATLLLTTATAHAQSGLLTAARVKEVKAAIAGADPLMIACRDQAVTEATGFLAQTPNPIKGELKVPGFYTKGQAVQQAITRQLRGDGYAANSLAVAFALTDRADFAAKSKEFVFAWVNNLTKPVNGGHFWDFITLSQRGDTPLVTYYSFPSFFYAYDILRSKGQISSAEHQRFVAWAKPFVDYCSREEIYKNNHHAWQVVFLASAGIATGDQSLFDRAMKYYRNGFDYYVAQDGSMWRELLRKEKAATYSLMALEAMVQFTHLAEGRGVNLKNLVGKKRTFFSTVALRVLSGKIFSSLPTPKAGGDLRAAVNLLRDFIGDPKTWQAKYGKLVKSATINGPAAPTDWGWFFEPCDKWWNDPTYKPLLAGAPYGITPPRAYTLSYATLVFRPIGAAAVGPAPGPAPAPAPATPAAGSGGGPGFTSAVGRTP